MASRAIVVALAAALTAAGCGESSTSGESPQIGTIAGVEVVTSEVPGVWAREGGAWQVDTTAATVIGELDGVVAHIMAVTQIGESFVAGTIRDELGVQQVVVYPLLRP